MNNQKQSRINPGTIINNYMIQKFISEGSFGSVYIAIDLKVKQEVAIKLIKNELISKFPKLKDLVLSEFRIMQKINNPNIVQFYEYFETKDYCVIVMEYCDQGDMSDYLQKRKQIPEKEAINLFLQLLNGLKGMHEQNIIHRDLKSPNILMKNFQIKIADLGFAKDLLSYNGLTNSVCGSTCTMAPEVIEQQPYGLEAWLYGEYPYNGLTQMKVLDQIKQGPPNFNRSGTRISSEMKDLITRMLYYNRYQRIKLSDIYKHQIFIKQDQEKNNLTILKSEFDLMKSKIHKDQNIQFYQNKENNQNPQPQQQGNQNYQNNNNQQNNPFINEISIKVDTMFTNFQNKINPNNQNQQYQFQNYNNTDQHFQQNAKNQQIDTQNAIKRPMTSDRPYLPQSEQLQYQNYNQIGFNQNQKQFTQFNNQTGTTNNTNFGIYNSPQKNQIQYPTQQKQQPQQQQNGFNHPYNNFNQNYKPPQNLQFQYQQPNNGLQNQDNNQNNLIIEQIQQQRHFKEKVKDLVHQFINKRNKYTIMIKASQECEIVKKVQINIIECQFFMLKKVFEMNTQLGKQISEYQSNDHNFLAALKSDLMYQNLCQFVKEDYTEIEKQLVTLQVDICKQQMAQNAEELLVHINIREFRKDFELIYQKYLQNYLAQLYPKSKIIKDPEFKFQIQSHCLNIIDCIQFELKFRNYFNNYDSLLQYINDKHFQSPKSVVDELNTKMKLFNQQFQ